LEATQNFVQNEEVIVKCAFAGVPQPTICWFIDGNLVKAGGKTK
jgi:hypothetical protein